MENFNRQVTIEIIGGQICLPVQADVEAIAIEMLGTHHGIFFNRTPFGGGGGGELVYERREEGSGWFLYPPKSQSPAPTSLPLDTLRSFLWFMATSETAICFGKHYSTAGWQDLFDKFAAASNALKPEGAPRPAERRVTELKVIAEEIERLAGQYIQSIPTFPNMKASDAMKAFRNAVGDALMNVSAEVCNDLIAMRTGVGVICKRLRIETEALPVVGKDYQEIEALAEIKANYDWQELGDKLAKVFLQQEAEQSEIVAEFFGDFLTALAEDDPGQYECGNAGQYQGLSESDIAHVGEIAKASLEAVFQKVGVRAINRVLGGAVISLPRLNHFFVRPADETDRCACMTSHFHYARTTDRTYCGEPRAAHPVPAPPPQCLKDQHE